MAEPELKSCPFCGVTLEIRSGKNPYGRHPKDSECIMAAHAVNMPYDVARWNRRAAASTSTDEAPDGWKGSKQDFDLCYNATPEQIAASLEKQRHDLTNLPENWDGYGAHPLPAATVDAMLADLEIEGGVVDLVPGADGSIQAEWHRRGNVDVEYCIDADGKRSLYVKIEAASTSTEGAGVKALEWGVFGGDTGLASQYFVRHHDNGSWGWHLTMGPEQPERFPTADEAKAAAQADYERRVLSCLNPPASKVTTDEAEERG